MAKTTNKDNNKDCNDSTGLIPDYSHTNRKDVPGKYKWKTEDIYPDTDSWYKDKKQLQEMMEKIPQLQKDWISAPGKMADALIFLDEMEKKQTNLYIYTSMQTDTDMGNSSLQEMKGEIHTLSVDISQKLTFFQPDILKLGMQKLDEYIQAEPRLKDYEFPLKSILRKKKHILAADKAGIVTQTALFSGAPNKASGILNDLDMPSPAVTLSDGKKVRLNVATYQRYRGEKDKKDRRKVMRTYWKNHTQFRNTHAALLDGAIKNHYFNARVHRYKNCLEAALFPKNIDVEVYHTLIHTIKNNLSPLHRYMKLKARLLNLDVMSYDDIYASSVPAQEKRFTIEDARGILLESLKPLGNEYIGLLKQGFTSGWTDLYPNKGKRSGAYSQGSWYDGHPFVLMNYNGKFQDVSTLTHEFGHALHSWFSNRTQPYPISDYPIFLAEIASTFNETLLVQYMVENETNDLLKLYILDQYIEGFRGTLYRQALFADYELAMHQRVEEGKTLTPDWLDNLYLRLTRLFYGHKDKVVNVPKYIENEWSGIPHFYYNFYVYQYSTGIIASTVLADMVLKGGRAEQTRYLDFLKSGGKEFPLDTLKKAGVDLTDPGPIEIAVKKFDEIVTQMEEIVQRIDQK